MSQSPVADPLAWRAVTAPSLVDFEILANEVYRGLPKKFRTLCEDLVIRIEDFATDEILNNMDIGKSVRSVGALPGGRLAVSRRKRAAAHAEHDLAVPAADPRLLERP